MFVCLFSFVGRDYKSFNLSRKTITGMLKQTNIKKRSLKFTTKKKLNTEYRIFCKTKQKNNSQLHFCWTIVYCFVLFCFIVFFSELNSWFLCEKRAEKYNQKGVKINGKSYTYSSKTQWDTHTESESWIPGSFNPFLFISLKFFGNDKITKQKQSKTYT